MTASQPARSVPQPGRDVVLETTDLVRTFRMGTSELKILKGVSVAIARGEFVAIEGRSGSGWAYSMSPTAAASP
jgi:putative ABC transport system ATP-binding protein